MLARSVSSMPNSTSTLEALLRVYVHKGVLNSNEEQRLNDVTIGVLLTKVTACGK